MKRIIKKYYFASTSTQVLKLWGPIYFLSLLTVVTISGCFFNIKGTIASSFNSSRAHIHLKYDFPILNKFYLKKYGNICFRLRFSFVNAINAILRLKIRIVWMEFINTYSLNL